MRGVSPMFAIGNFWCPTVFIHIFLKRTSPLFFSSSFPLFTLFPGRRKKDDKAAAALFNDPPFCVTSKERTIRNLNDIFSVRKKSNTDAFDYYTILFTTWLEWVSHLRRFALLFLVCCVLLAPVLIIASASICLRLKRRKKKDKRDFKHHTKRET